MTKITGYTPHQIKWEVPMVKLMLLVAAHAAMHSGGIQEGMEDA